jgi:ATP-dependent DNA helicase RecQ
MKPTICCELCSPAFFKEFAQVDMEKPKPIPSRSRIKDYVADAEDMNLRDALHMFRRQTTQTLFGLACLKNNGPGIFMSNEVLQRIVDCAHEYKIDTREDLAKETRWTGVHDHSTTVITLIKAHRPKPLPPPLLTSTPLCSQPGTLNQFPPRTPLNQRTVKSRKCSKCGSHNHICL